MASRLTVGIPVAQCEVVDCVVSGAQPPRSRSDFLAASGMPDGVNQLFLKACDNFPLRIWVIDNSGSMQTTDGKRIVNGPDGREAVVSASRWDELGDAMLWHARVAAHCHAPTELRLLNPPTNRAPQVLKIGAGGDAEAEVAAVRQLIASGPTGRTPLCEQIRHVVARVEALAPTLRANGQRVVVVIASDGAATDGSVAEAMRPLQTLPVWVVVRLCTDDEKVVEYWNSVDGDLELDMDVLDDLGGEAAEVAAHNPWLIYCAALHRLREWGCSARVMDLLDEKPLAVAEMREFVELVLGRDAEDLPDPQLGYTAFETALKQALASNKDVWCPLRRRKAPLFSANKLRRAYGRGGSGCSIM